MFGRPTKPVRSQAAWSLDAPLLRFSRSDAWTIGDACTGTQIFGATGSGKTSGSGRAIAHAMLKAGFGGLVLTAKPDDKDTWLKYAEETGRSNSVLVFGQDHPHRFNFLSYEQQRHRGSGMTENVVALFETTLAAMSGSEGGGGDSGGDPFWEHALRTLLRNTIDVLRLAGQDLSIGSMAKVITSAARSPDEAWDPGWRAWSPCWKLLEAAEARITDPSDLKDLEVTASYWCYEFPGMADRTRSSITSMFTAKADGLQRGMMRELFGTTTNVVPELTHEGVILIIDLPTKVYRDLGRFAQVLWKDCWQRATEARDTRTHPRPVFLWADEAQEFVTTRDASFQATARSSRACTVYLTQNLPSYHHAIGGYDAQAATNNLIGNLRTIVFHANADIETNQWAESMMAQDWQHQVSSSTQESQGQDGRKQRSINTSTSKQLTPQLLAKEFGELRSGGRQSRYQVDAIVFQSGRKWRHNGKNHLKVTFGQRS